MVSFLKYILLICILGVATTANAASQAGGFGAGPVYDNDRNPGSFSYELKPGDSFEDELSMHTTIPTKTALRLYVEAESGKEFDPKWVTLEKSQLELKPYGSEKIKFRIQVPPEAAKKKYAGILFTHRDPTAQDEEVMVKQGDSTLALQVGARVGIKILLVVTDTPLMPGRFKAVPKSDTVAFYQFLAIVGLGVSAGSYIIFNKEIKKVYKLLFHS